MQNIGNLINLKEEIYCTVTHNVSFNRAERHDCWSRFLLFDRAERHDFWSRFLLFGRTERHDFLSRFLLFIFLFLPFCSIDFFAKYIIYIFRAITGVIKKAFTFWNSICFKVKLNELQSYAFQLTFIYSVYLWNSVL